MKLQRALKMTAASMLLATGVAHATESIVYLDDDGWPGSGTTNLNQVTFITGTWQQSTFFPQTYGQGYSFSRTTGGTLTMRSNLDIDESGGGADSVSGSQFQAFLRWSAGPNRCNSITVHVRNATTNTLITSQVVNQAAQGRQFNWNPIGNRFTAVPNHLYEIRVFSPGGCVTTVDGGAFVQQTYDSSDVFNLTSFSTIDEAGLDFDNAPNFQSVSTIGTCATRTILKTVSVTVPDSTSTSYVRCTATGRTFHSQAGKWVFYALDDAPGTSFDKFAYTGVATTTSTYNNYDPYAMQHVYTIGSEGGIFTYYLKACREDTATTGTAYHDDFVCEMFPTRY